MYGVCDQINKLKIELGVLGVLNKPQFRWGYKENQNQGGGMFGRWGLSLII